MNDEEFTKEKMEHNPLVRHLFNKLNTEVTVVTPNGKYRGTLKTIDVSNKIVEVSDDKHSWYIFWRYIVSINTERNDL